MCCTGWCTVQLWIWACGVYLDLQDVPWPDPLLGSVGASAENISSCFLPWKRRQLQIDCKRYILFLVWASVCSAQPMPKSTFENLMTFGWLLSKYVWAASLCSSTCYIVVTFLQTHTYILSVHSSYKLYTLKCIVQVVLTVHVENILYALHLYCLG